MFDRNFFIKMIFFRVAYGTDSMGLRVADKDTTNGTERNGIRRAVPGEAGTSQQLSRASARVAASTHALISPAKAQGPLIGDTGTPRSRYV